MDILVLNTNFEIIAVLDNAVSVLWTDRYQGYGDFEIYTPVTSELLTALKPDNYLVKKDSEHVMIIEGNEIVTNVESGTQFVVTGRSLESILERRIIWDQTYINGNLQNGIQRLINESIISPSDSSRQISNFVFQTNGSSAVTGYSVETQFTGDNLYSVIVDLCTQVGLGFKITLNSSFQFVFSLYSGTDRSYDQSVNSYVVFSPGFENFVNGNYFESTNTQKTVALVAGEDKEADRKRKTVYPSGGSSMTGLFRRELYVDARDLQSTDEEGNAYSDETYYSLLESRGQEKLVEYPISKSFEGEVDYSTMYVYGSDFYMGDIVQIVNEFNISAKARITETVFSESTSEIKTVPTFTIID